MKFREMKKEDIKAIVEIYIKTFNSPPWNDKWTSETASKRLTQMMDCPGAYGILAYEEDLIIGMILGAEEQYYNGVMFNIKEFCVRNDIRSKGIGTRILNEFEIHLREKGISEIILLTARGDKTEGFYKKRGFLEHDEIIMMNREL